jgi:putative ABC transport system permease protein
VLAEALVVGLAASLVGIGVGIILAFGLQALLSGFGIDLPSTQTIILPRTIVVGVAVGTLVTVFASVAPARRASRVSPIEALREGGSAPSATPFRRVLVGSLLTLGGVAALLYGLFASPSNAGLWVGAGAALTFVGAAILSPLVTRPLAAVIGAPIRRLGFAGRLGHENAMRNPRRTASTSAALMIGLGLVTFVAVFGASLKASADAAIDETLRADFILSTDNFSAFSPQVAVDLEGQPEFAAVSPFRQGEIRVNDRSAFVSGVDPATLDDVVSLEFTSGSLASLEEPNTVLVYRGVADSDDLTVGDELPIEFASTGTQRLTVGGIFTDNRQLGDYAISIGAYEANFAQQLDFIVFTKLAAGTSLDEGRRAIERVVEEFPNVQVQDQAEYKEQAAQAIDQFLALVQVLLLLAIVIALFGIVNTLGLSIYERIRELGLLRAVGMGRRQVRRMIRSEAVIIAILGAAMGIVIGVLFGWAMQQALASLGINRLAIPVSSLLLYLVIAGIAGVVAAIWPARRAAKLNVLESIAYE